LLTSPFFRRLFIPYLLLTCAAVGAVGLFAATRLRDTYLDRTQRALADNSILIAGLIGPDLRAGRTRELNDQLRRLGQTLHCRISVVREDGVVVADNEADPVSMGNHRTRPEIAAAAAAVTGASIRPSATVGQRLLYFARRIDSQAPGEAPYFIRLAVHLTSLDAHLAVLYRAVAAAALLAMLAAGALCYYFARRQAAPLIELTGVARDLAAGQLHRRMSPPLREKGEIASVATALNTMADSLNDMIRQAAKDNAELLAILSSMSEGVLATDTQQRILLVNSAAAGLLGFAAQQAQGRFLNEVVRSEPVLNATTEVLASRKRKTFQVGPLAGRHVEVTITTFPALCEPDGLVIVAHDATQSVRYQELRKEFVANVSHELRTPLTAIKGFAETLRAGALRDDTLGPRYLATIEKHADQLTNLVNDLLELSRLESHPDLPRRVPVDVASIVRKAVDLLTPAAQKKHHTLATRIDPLPPIPGDADYLERAIANLIDNAVKYTPDGGRIDVAAKLNGTHAIIEVTDTGIGIPEADLPRIFERFYRVDRSRSREMGGTGLGLSIVKHVAQVHRGAVEVSSTPAAGSTFRLLLPLPAELPSAQ